MPAPNGRRELRSVRFADEEPTFKQKAYQEMTDEEHPVQLRQTLRKIIEQYRNDESDYAEAQGLNFADLRLYLHMLLSEACPIPVLCFTFSPHSKR